MAKKPYTLFNDAMREMASDISHFTGFSSLAELQSLRQYNGGAELAVISARFPKQLWDNEKDNAKQLHLQARTSYISSDFALGAYTPESFQNFTAIALRAVLADWFKGFKVSYSGVDYLPPGETVISARGRVSIIRKLKGPWTVTADAYDRAISMLLATKWMRKIMRARLIAHYGCWKNLQKELFRLTNGDVHKTYAILCRPLFVFVQGGRYSSVPKDTKKRRSIDVQPLWNVILQHSVGKTIRRVSLAQGNDLSEGQAHHREMILDTEYATVDFSAASDSISMGLVMSVLPRHILREVLATRTSFTYVGEVEGSTEGLETNQGWMYLNKVSAMGNGYTFELLTIILLGLARRYDKTARVYGDDVVIHRDCVKKFIRDCTMLGFRINEEKTFIKYHFRESCGAFVMNGEELLSFEFHQICNIHDLCITCNKLLYLSEWLKNRPWRKSRDLGHMLMRLRQRLLNIATRHGVKVPYGPYQPLTKMAWDEDMGRYRFNIVPEDHVVVIDSKLPRLRPPVRVDEMVLQYLKSVQLPTTNIQYWQSFSLCNMEGLKPYHTLRDPAVIGAAFFQGRRPKDLIRVGREERKFRPTLMVESGGRSFKVATICSLVETWEAPKA